MAGAVEDLQFAVGDALLQRESGPVRVVLATGDDDGWTGNLGVMALGLGLLIGLELGDDGVDIAEHVAIGEQVGEEMGHRRRAESGAEVLKGVAPTVADAAFLISLDARRNELLLRVVAGAAHDQRRGPLRAVVVHPDQHRRADGAADQDGALAGIGIVDRLPAGLCDVLHGEPSACLRRPPVARQIDGDAAIPGGHLCHLEDPARLVHRVWMHEGHNRAALAHRLVIKRSVDVLGHALPTWDWVVGSAPPALAQRLKMQCTGIRRSGAGPEAARSNRSRLPVSDSAGQPCRPMSALRRALRDARDGHRFIGWRLHRQGQ